MVRSLYKISNKLIGLKIAMVFRYHSSWNPYQKYHVQASHKITNVMEIIQESHHLIDNHVATWPPRKSWNIHLTWGLITTKITTKLEFLKPKTVNDVAQTRKVGMGMQKVIGSSLRRGKMLPVKKRMLVIQRHPRGLLFVFF